MARKSAASAKVAKKTEEEKWEEMHKVFDDAKWTFIETIKVQIKAAKRVDNFLNLRELATKFGIEGSDIAEIKRMQECSVTTYEMIMEIAEKFVAEDFFKATCPDPWAGIMPSVDEIKTEKDAAYAAIRHMSIMPYGTNLIQMHNLIMQEMERRGLKPKED